MSLVFISGGWEESFPKPNRRSQ